MQGQLINAIAQNLSKMKSLIQNYETKYGRTSGSVHLLAASKGQPLEKIQIAYQAGQKAFGENYLQEALSKITLLPSAEWHFIGSIQSNKTRKIAEHFSWVHSVDHFKIAKSLSDHRPSHLPALNICIQVNIGDEKTKSGISSTEVLSLLKECTQLPRLQVRGLMAIPPPQDSFDQQRKNFHDLFILYQSLCKAGYSLDTLSMGMSADFEAAIAEGSTMVRSGTAIFGPRIQGPRMKIFFNRSR